MILIRLERTCLVDQLSDTQHITAFKEVALGSYNSYERQVPLAGVNVYKRARACNRVRRVPNPRTLMLSDCPLLPDVHVQFTSNKWIECDKSQFTVGQNDVFL